MDVFLIILGLAPIVHFPPVHLTNITITQHNKLQALVLWLAVQIVLLEAKILCALPHLLGRVQLPVQFHLLGTIT
jgi:hypothetical protein